MIIQNIKRKWRAKGHGIHSPFAFDFVTKVFSDHSHFYAFQDIEALLKANQLKSVYPKLHRLSYRMVRKYKPGSILEINSGKGINTLYIASAAENSRCVCLESDTSKTSLAQKLLWEINRKVFFEKEIKVPEKFNALFLHTENMADIDLETLFEASEVDSFWVIHSIRTASGKKLWKRIVNDTRATVTFDAKDIGIVFLKKSFNPLNYLI